MVSSLKRHKLSNERHSIKSISGTILPVLIEPCNPSPCGINAVCREVGQSASCTCIRDYTGNPYIECKPECVVNAECPRHLACVNQHCVGPCPGVCGHHATCSVTNHVPQCRCDPGYQGDAFTACQRITTRELIWDINICNIIII